MESPTKRAYRLRDEVTKTLYSAAVAMYGWEKVIAVDNKTFRLRFNQENGGPSYVVITAKAEP